MPPGVAGPDKKQRFFDPRIRDPGCGEKNLDPGIDILSSISEDLVIIFGKKILKFCRGSGSDVENSAHPPPAGIG